MVRKSVEREHSSSCLSVDKVALGAFWPRDQNASYTEVLAALNNSLKVMSEQQTGLQGIGRTITQQWHNDVRKNEIIDHVREHLPNKMRESERRHPLIGRQEERVITQFDGESHLLGQIAPIIALPKCMATEVAMLPRERRMENSFYPASSRSSLSD